MWYATETFVSYSGGSRRVYVRGDVVPDDVAMSCLRLCRPSEPEPVKAPAVKRPARKRAAKRVAGG